MPDTILWLYISFVVHYGNKSEIKSETSAHYEKKSCNIKYFSKKFYDYDYVQLASIRDFPL